MSARLLDTADVAKLIDCTPANVRALARKGRIPFEQTASGRRVYRAEDVERLARERQAERAAAGNTHEQ